MELVMDQLAQGIPLVLIYSALGVILLFLAYKLFDWFTPNDLAQEIFTKGNVAAAQLTGAVLISVALIVSAVIN